jgi:hypothetical protein
VLELLLKTVVENIDTVNKLNRNSDFGIAQWLTGNINEVFGLLHLWVWAICKRFEHTFRRHLRDGTVKDG